VLLVLCEVRVARQPEAGAVGSMAAGADGGCPGSHFRSSLAWKPADRARRAARSSISRAVRCVSAQSARGSANTASISAQMPKISAHNGEIAVSIGP